MVWHIDPLVHTPQGATPIFATLRKWSYATGLGEWWNNSTNVFATNVLASDRKIPLAENPSASGLYTGATSVDLTSTYTGHILETYIFDISNEVLITTTRLNPRLFYCRNGIKQSILEAITPVAVVEVPEARTWIVESDGRVSGTKVVSVQESGTFSMDFTRVLDDNETSFSSADSVTDVSPSALVVSNVRLSGDKMKVYFDVAASAWTVATTYTMRVVGTATDGNKYSGDGTLKTRA